MIKSNVDELIGDICNGKMEFPSYFNTRELTHLQDSQKYFMYKKLRFIQRYAEIKIEQNWSGIYNNRVSYQDCKNHLCQ